MLRQRFGSDAIDLGTTCGLVRVGRWSRGVRESSGRVAQHLEIAMDASELRGRRRFQREHDLAVVLLFGRYDLTGRKECKEQDEDFERR